MLSRLIFCRPRLANSTAAAAAAVIIDASRRPVATFEAAPVAPRQPPRRTPNVMHGTRLGTDPRWRRRMRQDMYRRRMLAGPEPERPRSAWSDWNRRVELLATLHRLGLASLDGFGVDWLDRALTFPDTTSDTKPVTADAVDDVPDSVTPIMPDNAGQDNSELVPFGRALIEQFCSSFLAQQLPHVPSLLRQEAVERLTSDQSLAYVAGHLGLADLLQGIADTRRSQLPLSKEADAFAALVASAKLCCPEGNADGSEAAWRLTRDFLLTRLHETDINEWWQVGDPAEAEQLLSESLASAGFSVDEPLEFRLMRCSAPESPVYSCFQVGLYIRRELLASGFGETPSLARIECVSESLKILFDTADNRAPLNFKLNCADLQSGLADA